MNACWICRPGRVAWILCLPLILMLLLCATFLQAADWAANFDSANRLYEQGKFSEAADAYSRIVASGRSSPAVYFNLGNAFFKAGQMGRAILAYRQARAMAPRDPDVLANLQYARNQVQGPSQSVTFLDRLLGKLSFNEWTVASAASMWLWFLLLMLRELRPAFRGALRGWTTAAGALSLLLCGCLAINYYRLHFQPTAVVIASDAPLHQSPYPESAAPITLHDGAEVLVLDRKGDWLQVDADRRRTGWISKAQASFVRIQ